MIPNAGITFDLDMRLHEEAVKPRIERATDGMGLIIQTKIPDNLRVGRIGRTNFRPPTKKSIPLIEIGSLCDVSRDEHVILVGLRDAVYLDGEKHRDSIIFKLSRQSDGFGAAPTMPEYDDASFLFFFG